MIQSVYVLWLARNEARDGIQIAPPLEIMERVVHLLHEWRGIHQPTVKESVVQRRPKWEVPEEGWIKINPDGAVSKFGVKGGGGAVLRTAGSY